MKKFIIKSIYFTLFTIFLMGLSAFINYQIYSGNCKTLNNNNIWIVGDSHPQTSINPELFNDAINISLGAEPYVITFWKLKKIFQSNNPDTLILGFAPHNISAFNDLKFSNKTWSAEMFKRSYPIENFRFLDQKIKIDYWSYYTFLWKQIGLFPRLKHFYFIGDYTKSDSSNVSTWKSAIKRHYYLDTKELEISDVSISYLDSIINLCNSKHVKPILVSSPVHNLYYKNIPNHILTTYKNLMNTYRSKGMTIIDYTDNIYPDSLYLNPDHLNTRGAIRFTNEIIDMISSIDSDKDAH